MKIAALRGVSNDGASGSAIKDTTEQDVALAPVGKFERWRPRLYAAGAAALALAGLAWALHAWLGTGEVASRSSLRTAAVVRGRFVRDVAGEGTIVATVKPTLFAAAPGIVTYVIHAGDSVTKDQVLGRLDSPELSNEYEREKESLNGMDAAIARQKIEIQRQILTSEQQADLAKVAIDAADRELKRQQWAWSLHATPERDYKKALDDEQAAKVNLDHANKIAALEQESVALDLKTRLFERDRQALLVADLKSRVDRLALRSPVSGVVGDLAQPDRAQVAENAPLVTVVDLSGFEAEFHVAESYASGVKPGVAAQVTLAGRVLPGVVTSISPEVRNNEVTGRVKFTGATGELRQNERASVRLVLDNRDDVLNFERGAAIDETTHAVYVVRDDRVVRVPVELGAASISAVEVLRGLSAGDEVVVSDTRDFRDAPSLALSR
jgi:HlyD family secretion protein